MTTFSRTMLASAALVLLVASAHAADDPNGARARGARAKPAKAMGECKDGTSTTAAHERGACSRHGGVKSYGKARSGAPAASDAEHDAEPDAEHDAAPASAPKRR